MELSISIAQIIMTKSFRNAPNMLEFRKNVVEELVNGRTFWLTERHLEPAPIPHFSFNQDHFHYPIAHNNRNPCKVHIQRGDTKYTCAICGVRMCPDPCFIRYHTMVDYHFNDVSRQVAQRLREACGRPRVRLGRPRELHHPTQE